MFAIAIVGLGLGGIIRNTAGAVTALSAVLYLPLVVLTLPHPWNDTIGKFTLLMAAAGSCPSTHTPSCSRDRYPWRSSSPGPPPP